MSEPTQVTVIHPELTTEDAIISFRVEDSEDGGVHLAINSSKLEEVDGEDVSYLIPGGMFYMLAAHHILTEHSEELHAKAAELQKIDFSVEEES